MATPRFIRWIIKDWWLKLIALLAAVAIWFFAKLELEYTREIKLALDFSLLPHEYVVVESDVDSITVEVKSKGKYLLNLQWLRKKPPDPKIIMPVAGIKEGTERIRIGPENAALPQEIRVLSLSPYQIVLKIERRADRQVPVIVKPEGLPAEEFAAYNFVHYPTSVHIYGSQEDVKSTSQLFAEPLNIEGIKGLKDTAVIYEEYLKIELPEDADLVVEPSSLLVKYTVEPMAIKVLRGLSVQIKGKPPRGQVYLLDEKVDLTLQGPKSLIENLTEDSVEVTVSVTALDTGHHNVPASIKLPQAIQFQSSNPESFHIKIR